MLCDKCRANVISDTIALDTSSTIDFCTAPTVSVESAMKQVSDDERSLLSLTLQWYCCSQSDSGARHVVVHFSMFGRIGCNPDWESIENSKQLLDSTRCELACVGV